MSVDACSVRGVGQCVKCVCVSVCACMCDVW